MDVSCAQVEAEQQVLFANARSQMSQADGDLTSSRKSPASPAHVSIAMRPSAPPQTTLALPSDMYSAFDDDSDEEESPAAARRQNIASPVQSSSQEMLWVQVVAAVGLPAADSSGKSDPFVVLTIEPVPAQVKGQPPPLRQRLETLRCSNTVDPVWGECFSFSLQVSAGPVALW